jgi:hypothetical protein
MPILGVVASQISGHLTASDTGAMFPLGMVQVGSGGTSTISFTSIPQTYKHLQIRFIAKTTRSGSSDVIIINPNGSASTDGHYLYGNGASAVAGRATGYIGWATGTSAANVFSTGIIDILDYANTNKNKVIRSLAGYDNNGGGELALFSALQTSMTALSSFTITSSNSANFVQYTQFALYGIKGA